MILFLNHYITRRKRSRINEDIYTSWLYLRRIQFKDKEIWSGFHVATKSARLKRKQCICSVQLVWLKRPKLRLSRIYKNNITRYKEGNYIIEHSYYNLILFFLIHEVRKRYKKVTINFKVILMIWNIKSPIATQMFQMKALVSTWFIQLR